MNPLLTPEEVAERLAVSPKMIRAWLRDGRLPGIRLGRLWRVNPDALERFLEQSQTAQKMPPKSAQMRSDERTPRLRVVARRAAKRSPRKRAKK